MVVSELVYTIQDNCEEARGCSLLSVRVGILLICTNSENSHESSVNAGIDSKLIMISTEENTTWSEVTSRHSSESITRAVFENSGIRSECRGVNLQYWITVGALGVPDIQSSATTAWKKGFLPQGVDLFGFVVKDVHELLEVGSVLGNLVETIGFGVVHGLLAKEGGNVALDLEDRLVVRVSGDGEGIRMENQLFQAVLGRSVEHVGVFGGHVSASWG